MQTHAATVENSMDVPQKIKNRITLWPSYFTSGHLSKETQNTNLKEYMHPCVHCSIIYNSQDLEAAQVVWVDKRAVGHLHNGIMLHHKKKEVYFPFCDSMVDPMIIM